MERDMFAVVTFREHMNRDDCLEEKAISVYSQTHFNKGVVRGYLSVCLLLLSSPTIHLFICIHPPHLCTILKEHT
jgi:hypothetical protein